MFMNDTLIKKKLQNLFEHVHEQVREHLNQDFVQIVHEQEFDWKPLVYTPLGKKKSFFHSTKKKSFFHTKKKIFLSTL